MVLSAVRLTQTVRRHAEKVGIVKAKYLNDWNIVRIVETGTIGIIRNDCLPVNMKRHVCVQLQDKTAVVVSGNLELELYKDLPEIVYEALANINAAQQGVQPTPSGRGDSASSRIRKNKSVLPAKSG